MSEPVNAAHPGAPFLTSLMAVLAIIWPTIGAAQRAAGAVDTTLEREQLPLVPGRMVRFRVTEGTWMSLDVSPDGQTIVFDLVGDLYTLPITGGTARKLTSGTALNRQPRYSPDGRQLVFVSDRSGSENLWIADRDGRNARQLSNLHGYDAMGAVMSPAWAPDGRSIAVSQRLGATRAGVGGEDVRRFIWLMAAYDVATRQMRWVSDTVPSRARSMLGPAFDARTGALYAAINVDSTLSSAFGNWRIGRLEVGTGRLFPEMGAKAGRVGLRPVVSPNGRWLVYGSSSGSHIGLRLRDLTTDRERWLVQEVLDDPSGQEYIEPRDPIPGYAFTPDSKTIIAAYGGRIHRIDVNTGGATVIPFVAEIKRVLGPLTVHQFSLADTAVRLRGVLQPALSPDGKRVAFSALDHIWIMELPHDGESAGGPYRATTDSTAGEFFPAWSPDGESIVYSTFADDEGGAIRRIRVLHDRFARPPPSERLTSDTALYFHTAVTADRDRIVAVRLDLAPDYALLLPGMFFPSHPVNPTLVSVPSRGGAPHRIASLPLAGESARASTLYDLVKQVYVTTDPERIYVGLSSWGWDGTNHHMALAVKDRGSVLQTEQESRSVSGVRSPDGKRVLVSMGNLLYEVELAAGHELHSDRRDTLDAGGAQGHLAGGAAMVVRLWGTALKPWISWSGDGRRVVFAQGGVLYVGGAPPAGWITWQRVEVPLTITPDAPRGTIAFRGARLITMLGAEVIEHGDLLVRDNRIVALGPSGQVTIPRGTRIIDARGTTILPGYVDIHEHNGRPHGIHPKQSWRSLLELAYGVTAIRDPQSRENNDDFAYADRERAGDFLGPRMFSTGVTYHGPYPPIRSLADAREAVRRNAEDFRTETFKVYYDVDNTNRRARQLLAMATRDAGLNATVHTSGLDHSLASAIDGLSGTEHDPGIKIYDDVATLIAQSGTTFTPTYLGALFGSAAYITQRYGMPLDHLKVRHFTPPSARETTCLACAGDAAAAFAPLELGQILPVVGNAARIVARGGNVAIGAHGNVVGIGFHYEMWLYALGGMPNHAVLRSATIVGATAIGHQKDLGSLEAGKLADLQVLDKSPLEDIHNTTMIRYVMKNGRLYDANDLTEIWPRNRRLAASYFWEDRSAAERAQSQDVVGQHVLEDAILDDQCRGCTRLPRNILLW